MNKCCVHKKECEHATSYGVCLLSSAYDCKPIISYYCQCCNKPLLTGDIVYESSDTILCEACADNLLVYEDQLEKYILEDERKEWYLDDEISDIELFEESVLK